MVDLHDLDHPLNARGVFPLVANRAKLEAHVGFSIHPEVFDVRPFGNRLVVAREQVKAYSGSCHSCGKRNLTDPDAIINVEAISPVIAPLGAGASGSWFAFAHRIAAPLDKEALKDYARNQIYKAFRVAPTQPFADDPEPVPVLRVRGTGHTEMPLYPSLKLLRQAILDRYAGMSAEELDSKITQGNQPPDGHEAIAEKPYVALQRGTDAWGASRDNANNNSYPYFRLRSGVDEFVIVYGANHQTTAKATYASFTPYVDKDRWLGLPDGTITSNNYDAGGQPGDSARRFLCPGDPSKCPADVQYLYAWKVARGTAELRAGAGNRG